MVRTTAFRIAAWIALMALATAGSAPPASADAVPSTQTHYSTTITTVYGSQYPIAGHLDIQLSSTGILRGYYHNAYQKAFIQVVGGRDGGYIWFDIGPTPIDLGLGIVPGERLHVIGSINGDGSFRGQAFPQVNSGLQRPVDASSTSAVVGDQYLFAATPMEAGPDDYQAPGAVQAAPAASPLTSRG